MIEYYKEKLANLREVFRGVVLLLLSILSAEVALFVTIIFSGKFDIIRFVVFSIGFILNILVFIVAIKIFSIMNEYTKRIKDANA
ncbi:MAG: hypothetical protein GXO62_08505 [Epsilonproteobacteria bacterium]|nr:hypothetical protein [Campylobacterota bacterium]